MENLTLIDVYKCILSLYVILFGGSSIQRILVNYARWLTDCKQPQNNGATRSYCYPIINTDAIFITCGLITLLATIWSKVILDLNELSVLTKIVIYFTQICAGIYLITRIFLFRFLPALVNVRGIAGVLLIIFGTVNLMRLNNLSTTLNAHSLGLSLSALLIITMYVIKVRKHNYSGLSLFN